MIDLKKAENEFIKYTENYDLENSNIDRKQKHSIRVKNISIEIAKSLNLKQEEIELAALIGLLHDIGRFEQYTKNKTYNDLESFDHGDYGTEILQKDIRKYIDIDKYDNIILKAVKNHNKFKMEDELNEKEKLFCKIIRDADKLDIIFEACKIFWNGDEKEIEQSKIDQKLYEQFLKEKQIKRDKNISKDKINNVVNIISFIFDINFKKSFEIIKQEDYFSKIFQRFDFENEETKEKILEIQKVAQKYIKKKLGEN